MRRRRWFGVPLLLTLAMLAVSCAAVEPSGGTAPTTSAEVESPAASDATADVLASETDREPEIGAERSDTFEGESVTVPAGRGFVADLGEVSVEGGAGVFAGTAEVRLSYTSVGAGQHSGIETMAARPVQLEVSGAEIVGPLTLRFRLDTAGLQAEHVTPAVWNHELSTWVPTVADEVIVRDGEIIINSPNGGRSVASRSGLVGSGAVMLAAGGLESFYSDAYVDSADFATFSYGLSVHAAGPCDWFDWTSWACDKARIVTVFVPPSWRTLSDAAKGLLEGIEGIIDVGSLTGNAIVEAAREYFPKVIDAIAEGIEAGLEAGEAFYQYWVEFSLRDFVGLRASPPDCADAAAPGWVDYDRTHFSDTNLQDPRLHLCLGEAPDSDLRVGVVNNRNFGYQLTVHNGPPYDSFTADKPANVDLASLLANEANEFLIDNIRNLDGYLWPLSRSSFDISAFTRSDYGDWTGEWHITNDSAMLDAIRMASGFLDRIGDHVDFPLDPIRCAAPATGIVEQSTHWTAILDTAGSCLSAAAAAAAGTIVGAPVAAALGLAAQVIEAAVTTAFVIKQQLTFEDILDELSAQPPNMTVIPAATAVDPQPFSQLSDSASHWCGLRADGTIECESHYFWDLNNAADAPGGQFIAVAAGDGHSCGLRTDGTIDCWGGNDKGETDAPRGQFTAVAAGSVHSCGLRTDGTIDCWGDNDKGQTDAPRGQFTAVAAYRFDSCGLRTDGTIDCWGYHDYGQVDAPRGSFAAVSVGSDHACGLRTNGLVDCWGANDYGQVDAPRGSFAAVSAGGGHSCGLRTNGSIECWGDNDYGQTKAPSGRFIAVTASYNRSCASRANGSVQCWGHSGGE